MSSDIIEQRLAQFETGSLSRLGGFHDGNVKQIIIDANEQTLSITVEGFREPEQPNPRAEAVYYRFEHVSRIFIRQPDYDSSTEHLTFPTDCQIDLMSAELCGPTKLEFEIKGLYGWSMGWISDSFSEERLGS